MRCVVTRSLSEKLDNVVIVTYVFHHVPPIFDASRRCRRAGRRGRCTSRSCSTSSRRRLGGGRRAARRAAATPCPGPRRPRIQRRVVPLHRAEDAAAVAEISHSVLPQRFARRHPPFARTSAWRPRGPRCTRLFLSPACCGGSVVFCARGASARPHAYRASAEGGTNPGITRDYEQVRLTLDHNRKPNFRVTKQTPQNDKVKIKRRRPVRRAPAPELSPPHPRRGDLLTGLAWHRLAPRGG